MTRHELNNIIDFLINNVQTIEFPGTDTKLRYIPTSIISELDNVEDKGVYAETTRVSDDYSLDDIITILTDGLADECAFESVDYNDSDYFAAKRVLSKRYNDNELTLELIQAQMLLDGAVLYLIEVDTHQRHDLTLTKLIKGIDMEVEATMKEYECTRMHAICAVFEEGDFFTYHNILQYAVFGEVVYG